MKTTTIILFLCFIFGANCLLPSFIKKCDKNSKKLNACIKDNLERTKPYLGYGIPGLYVPKLEPYYVERLKGRKPGLFVMLEMSKIRNMRFFDIDKVDLCLSDGTFKIELIYPILSFYSTYTLIGDALGVCFNSTGPIFGYLNNYGVKIQMKGSKKKIDGDEYLIFEEATYETIIKGKGYVYLEGIVKDQLENKEINKKLNKKVLDFYKYLNPAMMKGLGGIIFDVVKNVFKNYCLKELFA